MSVKPPATRTEAPARRPPTIGFSVDADTHRLLATTAENYGISVARLCREIMRVGLPLVLTRSESYNRWVFTESEKDA
jgi:hypothetical protein